MLGVRMIWLLHSPFGDYRAPKWFSDAPRLRGCEALDMQMPRGRLASAWVEASLSEIERAYMEGRDLAPDHFENAPPPAGWSN